MPTISPDLPDDGESIDASDVNVPFNAILALLNGGLDGDNISPTSLPWSVMASFTNQIPASAMQDSGDLELFRSEDSFMSIASGLVWSQVSGLNGTMTAGVVYSTSGVRLSVSSIASRAFTASKDTYVSVSSAGAIAYSEVANGASIPALTAGHQWDYKVVTDGSAITSVEDMRKLPGQLSGNRSNNGSFFIGGYRIEFGWVRITYSASPNLTGAVTFKQAFNDRPVVVAICGGDHATLQTYGSGGNNVSGRIITKAHSVTTTGFTAHIHEGAGSNFGSGYAFVQWLAIGR